MSEWHGPRKCEECGAATCDKAWVGEFEYENGICRHFTKRGDRNGVIPLLCSGKMHPYDRRAPDPEKQELVGDMRQGLMSIRAKARFELDHPTGLHQTCLSLIAKEADALLRRREEKP